MAHVPPGWRLLTKSEHKELGIPYSRRVSEDPSGNVVPYARYLDAQAKRSGFKSHSDYRKHASKVAYFRSRNKVGADLSLGSDLLYIFHQAIIVERGENKAPHSSLAVLLETLDPESRPPGSEWPVGDSPR